MAAIPKTPDDDRDGMRDLLPLLDDAIAGLGEVDRAAIVLRFFQGESINSVAQVLGLNPNTAAKRLERAVVKLRQFFAAKGITMSAAAVMATLQARGIEAVPAHLASATAQAALQAGAAPAAQVIAKGTAALMTAAKAKAVAAVATAVLLAIASAVGVVVVLSADEDKGQVDAVQLAFSQPAVAPIPLHGLPQMRPAGPRRMFANVPALGFDAGQAPEVVNNTHLSSVRSTHWFKYENFDFAQGADRFSIAVALPAPEAPCTIEARLDRHDGPVIASVRSMNTESWEDFQVISAPVKDAVGVHDVYITFSGTGSPGNIQWFRFTRVRDASQRLDAVAYEEQQGIRLDGRGAALAFVDHGDWVRYADLEFSPSNKFFIVEVGAPADYAGKRITARLDSPEGQAIAELTVGSTGEWDEFHFQSTELTQPVSGKHDLYLTFSGGPGVGNIASIQFAAEPPKVIRRPKPSIFRSILRSIPMPPSSQPAKSQ